MTYLTRTAEQEIERLTERFPAVAIVGPRQVGKTSLALRLAEKWERQSVYLDMESPADLNKLDDPLLFLAPLQDKTVILDEVQLVPGLFGILRGLIDKDRVPRRFLLLGSASPELIRKSSESLAGRIAFFELPPLALQETTSLGIDYRTHWMRGGFPESLLAADEDASFEWREHFIQSYLERDLPLLGLAVNPLLMRRLWTMLAHLSGQLLNYESLSRSLGLSSPTVKKYIDFMEEAFLIRRIQPWYVNISKRLVKSPKVYIRDTGLLHALLNIGTREQLLGHPALGASWEGYVIQEILYRLPARHELCFYRTQDGTEADVVIVKAGIPDILIEIKHQSAPKVTKSMILAGQDLGTRRNVIVTPTTDSYLMSSGFEVLSYLDLDNLFME